MKSEDWVLSALRALAEEDREREAPEGVERRVLAAYRQKRARRSARAMALVGLTIAAAITLFYAIPKDAPKPAVPTPAMASAKAAPPQAETTATAPPPAKRVRRPVRRQPREVVTQFFPLLDSAPPFERGELLRVTVPASTMRRVGLPVNQDRLGDRVYADVLVGQEGLARAIRFVSYE